jgi:hypothetical protein
MARQLVGRPSSKSALGLASTRPTLPGIIQAPCVQHQLRRRNALDDRLSSLSQSISEKGCLSPVIQRTLWPCTWVANRIAAMLRALKFSGLLLINVLVALVGTAILETAASRVGPIHSLAGVLLKEWSLSIAGAALLGFGMWRTWRGNVAKWTWVLPTVWSAIRFFTAVGNGAVWFHVSGAGCANGYRSIECRNFFMFTIPCIRGLSYSLGAFVSSLVFHARRPSASVAPPSTSA